MSIDEYCRPTVCDLPTGFSPRPSGRRQGAPVLMGEKYECSAVAMCCKVSWIEPNAPIRHALSCSALNTAHASRF
jgi:hypothetical protein